MSRITVIWLDRESKTRRRATRSSKASARELARELVKDGHGDVRYRPSGDDRWRAVPLKEPKRKKRLETPFPPHPKSQKQKGKGKKKKGPDLLDRRLPGSFGSGKRR